MIEKKHVFFTCLCKTHSDHKGQQRSTASFSIRLKTFMYDRKKNPFVVEENKQF